MEDRGDVFNGRGSGDDPGSCTLDWLELMEEFEWETGEERIAIIYMGGDKCVDK